MTFFIKFAVSKSSPVYLVLSYKDIIKYTLNQNV